ncbi:glycosyltransferase 87 family protein [Tengunoibacter tsumagoiensis]|uniref:DUF2029 domain-containing protein n=1 Tax=Tengunoibacter tsumagoiensis TaxID=2014871 RepID=A0A401ZX39_9CHLR|nr:glycosyltransferase 87 family protein [Tengunoibacter tsumagoiensis]GCE11334.1 hypothetical protein KTT_11930 [Tengunoibacter tsumagoiensis]
MRIAPPKRYLRFLFIALDLLIIVLMVRVLFGDSNKYQDWGNDASRYQCYALAFVHGEKAATDLGNQCAFLVNVDPQQLTYPQARIIRIMQKVHVPSAIVAYFSAQSTSRRFHDLPHEYPMLVLIPLTFGLLGTANNYQVTFSYFEIAICILIYLALVRWRSRSSAIAFALLMSIGTEWVVGARFDIYPAALTLFAVMLAAYKKWNWAFVLLAFATLLKFYPVLLLLPFLLSQQREVQVKWSAWKRWQPLAIYCVICACVMAVSFLLYAEGTIAPFTYFGNRPIQVESLAASVAWLQNVYHHSTGQVYFALTFGSLNMYGPHTTLVSRLDTYAMVAGILYTLWLQWRYKIDLATSTLLILLVIIVTGKVFSPQYLIWILPLVAYVGASNSWWLGTWTVIGYLTTWIFPYIYWMEPHFEWVPLGPLFFPVTIARNFLFAGFTLACLVAYSFRKPLQQVRPLFRKSLPLQEEVPAPEAIGV